MSKPSKLSDRTSVALRAAADATEQAEQKKTLLDLAAEVEQSEASTTIEAEIAKRIEAGDLVVKDVHEKDVADAGKTAVDEYKAAQKVEAEARKERVELVKAEKLDLAMQVAPDVTIEAALATIPVGDEGDEAFASKLVEWKFMRDQIAVALAESPGEGRETASDAGGGKIDPLGGGTPDGDGEGEQPASMYM